jgi:hypothetical protein
VTTQKAASAGTRPPKETAMAIKQQKPGLRYKRPTDEQLRVRVETSILAAGWNALADGQRQSWGGAARANRRGGTTGRGRPATGRQLYFRVNSHRLALRLPLLLDPPDPEDSVQAPLVKLFITSTAARIALKLKVSGGDPEGVMVSSWYACNPGTMVWDKFVRIGFLPRPHNGIANITRLYVAKFGEPLVGMKVFVRVQQMRDYYGKCVQTTSAVVQYASAWGDMQETL